MEHKVYGASDDLVEVDGPRGDEFGLYDHPGYVVFANGLVLKTEYSPEDRGGIWAVTVEEPGEARLVRTECHDAEADPYSDVVVVEGEVAWIKFTTDRERAMRMAANKELAPGEIVAALTILRERCDYDSEYEAALDEITTELRRHRQF